MALQIDDADIDGNKDRKLKVNGGRRRLFVYGKGFNSINVKAFILNKDGDDVEDGRIVVYGVDPDDLNDEKFSVLIECVDKEIDEEKQIKLGPRTIIVTYDKDGIDKGKCKDNDNCVGLPGGVNLTR